MMNYCPSGITPQPPATDSNSPHDAYQLPGEDALQEQQALEVTRSQLSLILDGIDLASVRQRTRFQLSREALHGDQQTRR